MKMDDLDAIGTINTNKKQCLNSSGSVCFSIESSRPHPTKSIMRAHSGASILSHRMHAAQCIFTIFTASSHIINSLGLLSPPWLIPHELIIFPFRWSE